jgi:hypothetical protein
MDQSLVITPAYFKTPMTPAIQQIEPNSLRVDYGGELEIVEVAAELNDLGHIKESAALDADLPASKINRWLVKQYGNGIPVIITAHRGLQLPETLIQINAYNEAAGLYDVSFVRADNWVAYLKATPLNAIGGFDPFQLSENELALNTWLTDQEYTGEVGQKGWYTLLANFGGWQRFNAGTNNFEVVFTDFRLWFYERKLCEQMFAEAGYRLHFPFLQSDYGSKILDYCVGGAERYNGYWVDRNPNNLQLPCGPQYAFKSLKTADQAMTGSGDPDIEGNETIIFENDSTAGGFDNGAGVEEGFWNTTTNRIHNFLGKWRIKTRLLIQKDSAGPVNISYVADFGGPTSPFWPIRCINMQTNQPEIVITLDHPGGGAVVEFLLDHTLETCSHVFPIAVGTNTDADTDILAGSYVSGTGEFVVIDNHNFAGFTLTSNETILFPQSWLSPEVSCYDFLEWCVHKMNGKIDTNEVLKIVQILTDRNMEVHGQAAEGYYQDTQETDLSLVQVVRSRTESLKDELAPAKYVLGFKKASDAWIEEKVKNQPFDAEIDLRPYVEQYDPKKTQEDRNAGFEPTVDREAIEIKNTLDPTVPTVVIPTVWDNNTGDMSVNTGFRTVYNYGYCRQLLEEGGDEYRTYRQFWGGVASTVSAFPFGTQFTDLPLTNSSEEPISNEFSLVYDHPGAAEPLVRYWLNRLRGAYAQQVQRLAVVLRSFTEFAQISFRRLYSFRFDGEIWKGRITEKRGKVNDYRQAEIEVIQEKKY